MGSVLGEGLSPSPPAGHSSSLADWLDGRTLTERDL